MELNPYDLVLELERIERKCEELLGELRLLIVTTLEQSERTKGASTEVPPS